MIDCIRRKKVLKRWMRVRKLELIIQINPLWRDLSEDWGKSIVPFDLRPAQTFPQAAPAQIRNAGILRSAQEDGEKHDKPDAVSGATPARRKL